MGKLVAIIILVGLLAGAFYFAGLLTGNPNPQSAYVPNSGDCVVLPQGQDPVYDKYYSELNGPNCDAFLTQSEAHINDAQARQTNSETLMGQVYMYGFGGVLLGIGILFLVILLKK